MENKLEKIYKIIRVIIYVIPVVTVVAGVYLILFPVESYSYYSDQPKQSKFEIAKNNDSNAISFGVFPQNNHRYIDLDIDLKKTEKKSCFEQVPKMKLEMTYLAFSYPEGEPISSADQLKDALFADNSTKYPNGTLLHSKATNEVYILSHGKRILFPGPEIFTAFGYSFNNLVDADQSTIEQFPEADDKVFLWSQPHPDGVIFESFPSHSFYLILNGEKRKINDPEILESVWPENYSIPVSDRNPANDVECQILKSDLPNGKISCRFDSQKMPVTFGRYYQFSAYFQGKCSIQNIHVDEAQINFVSEKSFATIKNSIRTIFGSILTRYLKNS